MEAKKAELEEAEVLLHYRTASAENLLGSRFTSTLSLTTGPEASRQQQQQQQQSHAVHNGMMTDNENQTTPPPPPRLVRLVRKASNRYSKRQTRRRTIGRRRGEEIVYNANYSMDSPSRGFHLIFAQEFFDEKTGLETREGTDADLKAGVYIMGKNPPDWGGEISTDIIWGGGAGVKNYEK